MVTLANLYNESPTWLKNVHARLDAAVLAAYGWDAAISDDELLAKLLALNLERAQDNSIDGGFTAIAVPALDSPWA